MSKDEKKENGKPIKGKIHEEVGKLMDNKTKHLKEKIAPIEKNLQEEIEHVRNMSVEELEKKGKIIKGQTQR
jgi:uncharacterized protein YjbJ (UPF0337 family)